MQSQSYEYNDRINSLIDQYKEIGSLTKGQKLAIDKRTGKLVRSYGSTQGTFSRTLQSFSRTVASYSGFYNTDFNEVISKLSQIRQDFSFCLNHIPSSELKVKRIKEIKSVLAHAVESLSDVKMTSYAKSSEAQKNLDDQIDAIRKLVCDLESFEQVSEEPSDDEDWMLVQQPSQNPSKDLLGEEEFEFVQEKGEDFEKKISSFLDLIQDPKKLEEKTELTFSKSDEPVLEISTSIDENWEEIQKPYQVGEAFIANCSHDLFDQTKALELFSALVKNAPNAQLSPSVDDHWKHISEVLDKISLKIQGLDVRQQQDLKFLITDLVTGVLFPICDGSGNQRHLMPLNHLLHILQSVWEDPVRFLYERKSILDLLAQNPSFHKRVHLLFLFNFTNPNHVNQIINSPIFQSMHSSSHLEMLTMNSNVHVPQIYRQTCRGTTHNLLFQQHCCTIAEMLSISHIMIDQISANLKAGNTAELDAPAFKSICGKPISKKEFVSRVLQDVQEKVKSLEQKAVALAGANQCTAAQVAAMTREWNFMMQDLETIMDPVNPRIYDKQYLPDMYYVSAAMNVLSTWIAQIIPGQPLVSEKWNSLDNEKLHEIGKISFGFPQRTYLYRKSYEESNSANSPSNLSPMEIWEQLNRRGGGILEFFYLGGRVGSSGHMMFVKASLSHDEPTVEVWDPMSSSKKQLSIGEFKKILVDNYDARIGNVAIMSHLFFY